MPHRPVSRDQPGLAGLPVELKELICNSLYQRNPDGSPNTHGRKALVHLSSTSRIFRHLAQPLAYHSFTYSSMNLGKLVRTLVQRPDLAAGVKELHQPVRGFCDDSTEQLDLLMSVIDGLSLLRESQDISRFGRWDDQDVIVEDVCIELIIVLSPNLETVRLLGLEKGQHQRNQHPLLYAHCRKIIDQSGQRRNLPNLRHLELGRKADNMPYTRPSIDTAAMLSRMMNLRQLFIRGVSNLHDSTFGQEQFGRLQPTLHHLRVMELRECALETRDWGEIFLGQLISMAPGLEHFRYASEHYRYPEPVAKHLSVPHMLRAIHTRDSIINLKSLDICLGAFARCKWHNRGNVVGVGDLDKFSNLETLKLDENAVCRYYDSPLNLDLSVPVTTCLTGILPRGLKRLVIRVFKGPESHIWGDLKELAFNMFQFPRLESVVIQAISKTDNSSHWSRFKEQVSVQEEMLQEPWSKTGVDFQTEVHRYSLPETEHGVLGVMN
ncbi:hypothetical protein ACJZ2D_001754 [Fusarium nematophilum]